VRELPRKDVPRVDLSSAEAEHLLTGGGWHPGLRGLLDAAAAPGRGRELAGEPAARAVFAAAGILPAPEVPRRRLPRPVAVRTLTSVVALLGTAGGGVALAAGESTPAPTTSAPVAVPLAGGPPQAVVDAVGGALAAAKEPPAPAPAGTERTDTDRADTERAEPRRETRAERRAERRAEAEERRAALHRWYERFEQDRPGGR
jgi:hypothetical protein